MNKDELLNKYHEAADRYYKAKSITDKYKAEKEEMFYFGGCAILGRVVDVVDGVSNIYAPTPLSQKWERNLYLLRESLPELYDAEAELNRIKEDIRISILLA